MTTAPSAAPSGFAGHGERHSWRELLSLPRLVRTPARREMDPISGLLIVTSILVLWTAFLIAVMWTSIHLEVTPVDPASFHRWWLLPAGLLVAVFGLCAAAYRRDGRRSAIVGCATAVAGLAAFLPFCPYL
jgi:peptidoglycan/LPS O-acetylase OafA/YrhL